MPTSQPQPDALAVLDECIERAQQDVGYYLRKVKSSAEDERAEPTNIPSTHPGLLPATALQDHIALHSARAVVAALRGAWVSVARAQRGPL